MLLDLFENFLPILGGYTENASDDFVNPQGDYLAHYAVVLKSDHICHENGSIGSGLFFRYSSNSALSRGYHSS